MENYKEYGGNKITLLSDSYLNSYTNILELCVLGNIYEKRGKKEWNTIK